jgi:hypothetical protein|tara:strand:- start:278 stop:475 length:198 start_codon:yes stop_codon:yes gene_type:complete
MEDENKLDEKKCTLCDYDNYNIVARLLGTVQAGDTKKILYYCKTCLDNGIAFGFIDIDGDEIKYL